MRKLIDIVNELEGDWYTDDPGRVATEEIIEGLLKITEELAFRDPADGSWLIEPKQLREKIRNL